MPGHVHRRHHDPSRARPCPSPRARVGATAILSALSAQTPECTRAAIEAAAAAVATGIARILGRHLQGPYRTFARKGTHDAGETDLRRSVDGSLAAVWWDDTEVRCA